MEEVKENSKINVVPTTINNIGENAMWCSTFQLLWKNFQYKMLKNKFNYNKENYMITDLINANNEIVDLSKDGFYKVVDRATTNLKKEIERKIKKIFNEDSDILNKLTFDNDPKTNKILFYAMLKKDFPFKYQFENLGKDNFGNKDYLVDFFGMNMCSKNRKRFAKQVKVLFYNNEEDFAIKIKSTKSTNIVLYRNSENKNFANIYTDILTKTSTNKDCSLKKYDRVKIPKLNININRNYKEIVGEKITRNSDGIEFTILNALQTIDLKLDEKGGKIKSEASLKVKRETCSYNPINISERLFHFDNTFYMFLLEDKKHKPYFAMRVNDINLFN